jgi:hypothetical protein
MNVKQSKEWCDKEHAAKKTIQVELPDICFYIFIGFSHGHRLDSLFIKRAVKKTKYYK